MARTKSTVSLLLFFFLFTVESKASTAGVAAAAAAAQSPKSNGNKTIEINRFIWKSCKVTLYHRLCYASLASYAAYIQNDPVLLSAVSANVTVNRIRLASAHVSTVRHSLKDVSGSSVDPRTASALEDCEETLEEAVDLTRKSAGELKALRTAKGADVAWHVGNAQTWMSAALSYEETCVDGLKKPDCGVKGGSVEADVVSWVKKTQQYSSNSLALVNSLVNR